MTTVETGLGAVALVAATSGAFLIAGGAPQQLLTFFGLVSAALAVAGVIVVLRINQHEASVRSRLSALLPGELRSFGDVSEMQSLDTDGLFSLLETYQQEQQELLNANCLALIHGAQTPPELAQAEDELCQLRAELAALEDQFRSEQLLSSHFYHLGDHDPRLFRPRPDQA